jgi:hypothetical protein
MCQLPWVYLLNSLFLCLLLQAFRQHHLAMDQVQPVGNQHIQVQIFTLHPFPKRNPTMGQLLPTLWAQGPRAFIQSCEQQILQG